jgi:hypothetical protein
MNDALLTLYFLAQAVTLGSPNFQAREAATRALQGAYPAARAAVILARRSADPEIAHRAGCIWRSWKNQRVVRLAQEGFSQCYWQIRLYEPTCSLNQMCKFLPGNIHLQVSKEP